METLKQIPRGPRVILYMVSTASVRVFGSRDASWRSVDWPEGGTPQTCEQRPLAQKELVHSLFITLSSILPLGYFPPVLQCSLDCVST